MKTPAQVLQPTQRLQQISEARRAWFGDGALVGAPRVEEWIERSWRRCLSRGMHPEHRIGFEAVSRAAMDHAREASQPLLRAATPVIRSLTRAMADTGYFAILTNAQGVVIDVNGPIDQSNRLAHLIARVGVDLSEQAIGTTAIGTTLAEQQPVWLHRGEHFFEDTEAYSCAGAPIFGPDGSCVGMLDLTGVNVTERPALKHLVTQSALSIETALLMAQPHRLLLRLTWPGQTAGGDNGGLIGLDDDGVIIGGNRAAAHMLGLTTGQSLPHCSEVFAVAHQSLFDAASIRGLPIEIPLWSGLRVQVQARSRDDVTTANADRTARGNASRLRDMEEALIRKAVDDARGNVTEAARALGISRATIYRKLQQRRRPAG